MQPAAESHAPCWPRSAWPGLLIVVVVYTIFATMYAFLTPPYESPDEPGHLNYINFIAETGQLSDQYSTDRFVVGEGHQYPLYYLLAGAAVRLLLEDNRVDINAVRNENLATVPAPSYRHATSTIFPDDSDRWAFYGLRLASVALGLLHLLLIYAIAGFVIRDETWQLVAVLLAATLPQFQFISGSINNDNLANLLLAVVAFCLLRLLHDREASTVRWFAALGVALGLALLTKKTSLFVLPAVVMAFGYLLLSRPDHRQRVVPGGLLAVALALVVSGPLFVRNWRVYGDPLGNRMERDTMPSLLNEKPLWTDYWLDPFLPGLLESFVGQFGWLSVRLLGWVYTSYILLIVVALMSAIGRALARRTPPPPAVWMSALLVLVCFSGIVIYNLTFSQYQGRFLFPVLAPICALLALGLRALAVRLPDPIARMSLVALLLFFIVIDLLSLITLHRFFYSLEQYM